MSKFRFVSILGLMAAMVSMSAFAGDNTTPGNGNSKPISWDELKERCAHPERFDVQRAPQNIKIQCSDTKTTWAAAAPGEVALPGKRKVTAGVFADKFFVNHDSKEVPVYSKTGSCHRFKEIEETMTIERAVSCADILNFKGDLSEFCVSAVDAAKGSNPKLVEQKETGDFMDTCGGGAIQHGDGKPKR